MNQVFCEHLAELKEALLSLPATGGLGFEGLVSVVLAEITGVPFRLAASGLQFGIDGGATYQSDSIAFEAKRYDKAIPREKVLSKLDELDIREHHIDIWILGATAQIGEQLASALERKGAKMGVFVLILDWTETGLPPFGVALAMGGKLVTDFLNRTLKNKLLLDKALVAIDAIVQHEGFQRHAAKIRKYSDVASIGLVQAKKYNTRWLNQAFSNRRLAKRYFRQPIAPNDSTTLLSKKRQVLLEKLLPYFTNSSDNNVTFITGDEGHGKSWIIAQCWLELESKPIMIFLTPEDFHSQLKQSDISSFIISKLIEQTDDEATPQTKRRWQRRLKYWQANHIGDRPKLLVVIDGINQRPELDWARWIEIIHDTLKCMGGLLFVTVRQLYLYSRVLKRIDVDYVTVEIPQWTPAERDEILLDNGIDLSTLYGRVSVVLCNPRILGIAMELLDRKDVTSFVELTVSRLLFEHIRINERDSAVPQPADLFAKRLQKDAQEILARLAHGQKEDLTVFEGELALVASGHFYQAIDNDPTLYSLQDEGLVLALGFSIRDRLKKAQRNKRDMDNELSILLEPIAALDDTTDVVLAALTIAILDEFVLQPVAICLIKGLTLLQNLNQNKLSAFVGLVKKTPQHFLIVAREFCLDGGYQRNFDWIEQALIIAGNDGKVWPSMIDEVKSWLSFYSLSCELRTSFSIDYHTAKEVAEERQEKMAEIKNELSQLSVAEKAILTDMQRIDSLELSVLFGLALKLLAGKSLALFSQNFVHWRFAQSLNSNHHDPYKDFIHLIWFNTIDWQQTREGLLSCSKKFRKSETSLTGKWALSLILCATGHDFDEQEQKELVTQLTNNTNQKAWRLIEEYCSVDPCDPTTQIPSNIKATVEKYKAIQTGQIHAFYMEGSEDHFWKMARSGLVRFSHEVVVAKHREFIADFLTRKEIALRQGIFGLILYCSLILDEHIKPLIDKWRNLRLGNEGLNPNHYDIPFISQDLLKLVFPYITAQQQLDLFVADEMDGEVLLDLLALIKPLQSVHLAGRLLDAHLNNDERKQYLLILFATHALCELDSGCRHHIVKAVVSSVQRVREQALNLIATLGDEIMLEWVVNSGICPAEANASVDHEAWYGSLVLLQAAQRQFITEEDVMARIAPRAYGLAVSMLGPRCIRQIASHFDIAIKNVIAIDIEFGLLELECRLDSLSPNGPIRYRISEKKPECNDYQANIEWGLDSEKRQNRSHGSFFELRADLIAKGAGIIFERLRLDEFAEIVAADSELSTRWYRMFMAIDTQKIPALAHFILMLAYALSNQNPQQTKKLLEKVQGYVPMVNWVFGINKIALEATVIWRARQSDILDELRFKRLDDAQTDHELALEVMAAIRENKEFLVANYVDAKLQQNEPSEVARGLMVIGFSDQNFLYDEILERYVNTLGVIGVAYKAAKYAYERNQWARHWFEQMSLAEDPVEFWRYQMLFLKIVDGRFDAWQKKYEAIQVEDSPAKRFSYGFTQEINHRLEDWAKKRQKTLFGEDAPNPVFLSHRFRI